MLDSCSVVELTSKSDWESARCYFHFPAHVTEHRKLQARETRVILTFYDLENIVIGLPNLRKLNFVAGLKEFDDMGKVLVKNHLTRVWVNIRESWRSLVERAKESREGASCIAVA